MNIPLYILGNLIKFGSQHGYLLKKNISKTIGSFYNIKLPTIYYHLEKLENKDFITSSIKRSGKRPEKLVYTITPKGREEFFRLLSMNLQTTVEFRFMIDSVLFFADFKSSEEISEALKDRARKIISKMEKLVKKLEYISAENNENIDFRRIIIDHHRKHYHAELQWIKETVSILEKE